MTHCRSIRWLHRLALGLSLAALTPLAHAQHSGGGGGGSARSMGQNGGGGQPGGQMGGGQMGGADHGGNPAMNGPQNPNGTPGNPGFRGEGGGMQPAIRSGPVASIPGRFWDDSRLVRTLRLRPDQQHRMDAIFDANRSTLQTLFSNLQREEATLSSISPKNTQDQTRVFAAIDRVAQARADLEKEKKQLTQALRKEMDPQQVQQFDQMASPH